MDIPWCTELLSDILQNSLIDTSQMEAEKHVILREMEEVEKSVEEVIFDRLHMTAFRDDPLGFTILVIIKLKLTHIHAGASK